MTSRMLMVSRMDPASADTVAQLFAEHDRMPLPVELGLQSRTLLHYQGLTMHLIQAQEDFFHDLRVLHDDTSFQKLNQALAPHMSPIVDNWRGPQDSRAWEFYHRIWD